MPPCGKPPMPDDEEKGILLSLYFRYVHPGFPILYKSHFLKQAFDKKNSQSPALMSAVYAAASTYKIREVVGKADLARARIQMVVHFQRAKLYLDEQYTYNNTPTILTLLLMSVYEQGTMSTRSWLYSGMAVRKAYDLGIHRDVGVAKNNVMAVVSSVEAEIRQRAWWGCYIMDIMVSATLGRPTTIR
ncbi:transcription factor domain-containing protein, partial [Kickxella alabastrina]|uniref:transcription factor domain-containing protein n=1 Tax=Kickxella alabastrina TaxID=61397 RepID=UPI0022210783